MAITNSEVFRNYICMKTLNQPFSKRVSLKKDTANGHKIPTYRYSRMYNRM